MKSLEDGGGNSELRPKRHSRSTLSWRTTYLSTVHIAIMPPNKGGNSKKEAGRAKKAENEVGGERRATA